jgi:hypothetical protein
MNMPQLPIDKIENANKSIARYNMNLEFSTLGIIQEGKIDELNRDHHFTYTIKKDPSKIIELKREGDVGYSRRGGSGTWDMVKVPKEFPKYLPSVLKVLTKGELIDVKEADQTLEASFRTNNLPPIVEPEKYYRILLDRLGFKSKKFLNKCIEFSKELSVSTIMSIDKSTYKIKNVKIKVDSQVESHNIKSEVFITFGELSGSIPKLEPKEIIIKPDVKRFSSKFLRLTTIGGWPTDNHQAWAQESINLIKGLDIADGKYAEIYDEYWNGKEFGNKHPIAYGAFYEDKKDFGNFYRAWFDFDPNPYTRTINFLGTLYTVTLERDYNHFGGEDLGLEHRWYFSYRQNTPEPHMGGDRYSSARDWGFGESRVDPKYNRMTFQEAIRQYGKYSILGQRNAYLILGHIVHLLQDQGDPDHANLVAHPGSNYNQEEAYSEFHVCLIGTVETAVESCAVCAIVAGILTLGAAMVESCSICGVVATVVFATACLAIGGDSSKLGYERLVGEKWSLNRVKNQIKDIGIIDKGDYDDYFRDLANFSRGKSSEFGLNSPLGLGPFPDGFEVDLLGIPGINPLIGPDDYDRYLGLTDAIVPAIIGYSSGLIRYFYEIVNYPPYVMRVAIVKSIPGQKPVGFSMLDATSKIIYDMSWTEKFESGQVVNRVRLVVCV